MTVEQEQARALAEQAPADARVRRAADPARLLERLPRTAPKRGDLRLARALVLLIALVLVGMGVLSVLTGHYAARAARFSNAQQALDGPPAVVAGYGLMVQGLLPMALWFSKARAAGLWATACALLFLASLYIWL